LWVLRVLRGQRSLDTRPLARVRAGACCSREEGMPHHMPISVCVTRLCSGCTATPLWCCWQQGGAPAASSGGSAAWGVGRAPWSPLGQQLLVQAAQCMCVCHCAGGLCVLLTAEGGPSLERGGRAARLRRVYFYVTVGVGMHMSVMAVAAAAAGARVPSLQAGRAAGRQGQRPPFARPPFSKCGGAASGVEVGHEGSAQVHERGRGRGR
jgi:hypothetical protein